MKRVITFQGLIRYGTELPEYKQANGSICIKMANGMNVWGFECSQALIH